MKYNINIIYDLLWQMKIRHADLTKSDYVCLQ